MRPHAVTSDRHGVVGSRGRARPFVALAALVAVVLSTLVAGVLPAQADESSSTKDEPTVKVGLFAAEAPNFRQDVQKKLQALDVFATVDIVNYEFCSAEAPSLSELQPYDALLVWTDCGFGDSQAVGDVLADYVDDGGRVVVATFAGSRPDGSLGIGGRFHSGSYLPVTTGSHQVGDKQFLDPVVADDPLLVGVTSFDGGHSSYHHTPISVKEGATLVARWSGGQPLVVRGPKSTFLNFFPPSNAVNSGSWDAKTDGARLMANALGYVSRGPSVEAPAFTSADSASFEVGEEDSFTVTSSGKPAATISTTSDLPDGLTLKDSGDGTATLSGTPGVGTGGSHTIELTAANGTDLDATQTLSVSIDEAPGMTSPATAGFTVGDKGSFTITTAPGHPRGATLSLEGALPPGLTFTDAGDGTAIISGTPEDGSADRYPLTVTAKNAVASSTQDLALTVALAKRKVAITSTPPAEGVVVGQSYEVQTEGETATEPVVVSVGEKPEQVCSVDGATVTFQHPGSCVIEARRADGSRYAADSTSQTVAVTKASTTTKVTVRANELTATVAPAAPGAGSPSGTVTFAVDGKTVGTAKVSDGTATLAHEVGPGQKRAVAAAYSGDDDFTGSEGSTARQDPTITAKVTSAAKKSKHGWYRTPVTVSFRCTTPGGALTSACPKPVTLSKNGAGQTVTRTVLAEDGGAASVTVKGVNVDRTAPRVSVKGVKQGRTYPGKAPRARCAGSDGLSGLASCTVKRKVSGERVTVTAKATDRAGNTSTTSVRYRVARFYVAGATFRDGAWHVRDGKRYQVVALTSGSKRPEYYNAAPRGSRPTASGTRLARAGKQSGLNRYSLPVTMDRGMSRKGDWVIGVKVGSKLHQIPVRVRR